MGRRAAEPLLPGATVGVVGGGQLGLMLGAACRRMGYRFAVLAPEERPPAAAVADLHLRAPLDAADALRELAQRVDVVTFEFENVSSAAFAAAETAGAVRPSARALHLTQHRGREKGFLAGAGLPLARWRAAADAAEVDAAIAEVGTPCVVKTAGFGYDGKGQVVVAGRDGLAAARALAAAGPVVVEERVDLAAELSVVVARGVDGEVAAYAPFVNRHEGHVLDVTVAPFAAHVDAWRGVDRAAADRARDLAVQVAERLDLVGVCCVEFFLSASGELLVNEVAPRPHNSGHLTIEAAPASQFEQQLRAVCGLPLGATTLARPAAMANLLGGLWADGTPDFAAALAVPGVSLHLYGKEEARPGRKMGHLTAVADDPGEALARVLSARAALTARRRA
ncbi:MAG TPA: 5-(carboxyamino)imidazole ribonucleotide synthase [Trueperaceae bacterium]|nr:5-(carboxyamino)imidazole ribonucleotide synthase [Trueperaceae bacterium]